MHARHVARIATLLAFTLSLPLFALDPGRALTQYVHRIWQSAQGLPEGTIFEIFQTSDRYLWLATQSGLMRFDGVRFTPVEEVYPGAPREWVRAAAEDRAGRLWIATNESGVYSARPGEVVHYGSEEGMPSDATFCVVPTPDGAVWVCTENGLVYINPDDSTQPLHTYNASDGLAGNNVRAACLDNDGNLWVTSDDPRVSVELHGLFTVVELQGLPSQTNVLTLACDGDTVWAGTSFGLVRIQDGQQTLYTAADGLASDFIFSLAVGADETLWIGTRSGFSRLRGGTFESFRSQEGLSQGTAQTVYEDHEGSLWVGTKRGLNQFVDGRSVPYTAAEGLPSNSAGPVLQEADGTIWAGTLDAGLAHFDGRRFSALTTREGLPSNRVNTLARGETSLWAGTDNGLALIRDQRVVGVYGAGAGLPSRDIRSLYRDRQGTLWVGTAAGLVGRRGGSFFGVPGAPRSAIRTLGEDRDGNLVVATDEGLWVSREGRLQELTQDGIYLRNANAFYLDSDGLLWVGMNGSGLRVIDGGRVSGFYDRDGLYDSEIYGIVEDRRGRLWMTCSRGIFAIPREELLQLAAGELNHVTSFAYSPTDALRVLEGQNGVQPSLALMNDGRIWFSTIRGLIAFAPFVARPDVAPQVVLEDPIVDGRRERPEAIEDLPAGQKNIQFNFTGLSFIRPDLLQFRYRLDGYDEDWVDAGTRREAFYTNLPPGDYRFRAMVCNGGGPCNGAEASVSFSLTPMFYERAWFWPLLMLAGGLIAWLGYQLHIRRLRERYDLILSERSRIARELHDTLIQGFSGVTMALQGLSARIGPGEAQATLDDIIEDAATCLRETRQSVAGLRSVRGPQSGLAAAVGRAAREITETKDAKLKLALDRDVPQLPGEVEYNLLRIVSEAVANSVKHSGASTIEVTLKSTPDGLWLAVRDDGAGFRGGDGAAARAGHYGIIGMKERANQIGAELELISEPGGGTTVSVVLPAGRALEASAK